MFLKDKLLLTIFTLGIICVNKNNLLKKDQNIKVDILKLIDFLGNNNIIKISNTQQKLKLYFLIKIR